MIPAARGWRGNYPLWLPLAQGEDGIVVHLGIHRSVLGKGEEVRRCCIAVLSRVRLSPCVRGSRRG